MSAIQLQCPHCQKILIADPALKKQCVLRCKHCSGLLRVSPNGVTRIGSSSRIALIMTLIALPILLGSGITAYVLLGRPSSETPLDELSVASVKSGDGQKELGQDKKAEDNTAQPAKQQTDADNTPKVQPGAVTPQLEKTVIEPQKKQPEQPNPALKAADEEAKNLESKLEAKVQPVQNVQPAQQGGEAMGLPGLPPAGMNLARLQRAPGVLVVLRKDEAVQRTPPRVRPAGAAPLPSPPMTEKQRQVQAAVERGLRFLASKQQQIGNWQSGSHAVGGSALPGLAMLEGGVPANHPVVQRTALFVRSQAAGLTQTYDLSLAILFLDRLGNPDDRALIQMFSLRLIAGQQDDGGWGYTCPIFTQEENIKLITFLKQNQPSPDPLRKVSHPFLVPLPKEKLATLKPLRPSDEPGLDPLADLPLNNLIPLEKQMPAGNDPLAGKIGNNGPSVQKGLITPLNGNFPQPMPPFNNNPPANQPPAIQPANPRRPEDGQTTVVNLKELPRVPDFVRTNLNRDPNQPKEFRGKGIGKGFGRGGMEFMKKGFGAHGRTDNSNTQFAILALWAARRHGVPMALTLNLLDERFRTTQADTGGWSYLPSRGGQTAAMTCVGLLGLGVAHGSFLEAMLGKNSGRLMFDPAIQKGFGALGGYIGNDSALQNLYFLWSVERVGVMYQVRTIAGKDWHAWGSNFLMNSQQNNGSWTVGHYPGSSAVTDTSMAILFLRRANLTRDLSDGLRRFVVVPDQ